jgi:predicted Zn-dependent protease
MKRTLWLSSVLLVGSLVFCAPLVARGDETDRAMPTAGFNLFSVQQDVEIGRQSAVEAERQLPLLRDRNVDSYLNKIISKLAAKAPGARYPYAIKAVNASEINAFSLPGGPMYVNRGLVEAARSEAELAGVLAHEMSHVALRHGTHQASKAYLGQAGLGILGGLLGKNGNSTAQIVNAVGGLGLNAVFLKFSRDAEYQADQLGAQIMAGAGYNPVAMATLFELLRSEQGRDPGKVEKLFSDHPPLPTVRRASGNRPGACSWRRRGMWAASTASGPTCEALSRFPAAGRAAFGRATQPGQPQPGPR